MQENESGEELFTTSLSDEAPDEAPAEEIVSQPMTDDEPLFDSAAPAKEAQAPEAETETFAAEEEASRPAAESADEDDLLFSREDNTMYNDAHYVPVSEHTVPPRYYTPPTRSEKKSKDKPKRKTSGVVRAVALCLVCALLGGIGGAAIVGRSLSSRIDSLEQQLESGTGTTVVLGADASLTAGASAAASTRTVNTGSLSLSDIYALACEQVVGITTEVTYQNYFGQTSTSAVTGSGFIISEDGYILTNYHVIEYAYERGYTITVMMHDGSSYEASIVGVEAANDVAVLKIDATGLSPVVLGNSDSIAVGDEAYAIGNPLGELEFTMTFGHVSALDRVVTTDSGSVGINMFQIDAAVNSGNSGGPVYNDQGEVIGVVTAKYSSTGVEGLGFAIPINDAVKIAQDLITKGYVTGKAYLGVYISQQYNAMYAQYYGMPLGAYVTEVESGSCAEKAGLQAGDVITAIGSYSVSSYTELKQVLQAFSAGETATISIYRADESLTLTVTFDEARPSNS